MFYYRKGVNDLRDINELLQLRIKELNKIIKKCRRYLAAPPEGTLRAVMSRGKPRYYYREKPSDRTGTYLNSKNLYLAKRLAQRDYCYNALDAATREMEAIKTLIRLRSDESVEDCHIHVSEARKPLITSVVISDEEYARQWQEIPYTGKPFLPGDPDYRSLRDERMRSKSEVIIADLLSLLGIPYKYECPLTLKDGTVIYPDFTILNKRTREVIIFEHLGMMGDENYAAKNIKKINSYLLSGYIPGINLILSFESNTVGLNIKAVETELRALAL